jgi:transketolase
MRTAFSNCLVRAAKADRRVLLLTGDHGYALFDDFRRECASQYINAGVAEQNMVGVAAGLAKVGFFPIVYGLSAFVPMRVLEQIKLDLCYEGLPALVVGDGAGVVYSHLGTSHQCTEDIGALRSIPGVSIYSPADAIEMHWCFSAAIESGRTTYLRMGKADLGQVHESGLQNKHASPVQVFGDGVDKVAFIATGSMLKTALEVARRVGCASVWSVPRLKPLDAAELDRCLGSSSKVVTFEEHSIYGGLGDVIAERIAGRGAGATLLRIGIDDRFSQLCGTYQYLIESHGLGVSKVEDDVRRFLAAA